MIQSLMRSLDLLEVLKGADHKISIAELSEQLELPPSTIHRILHTFCEKKYVIRDEYTHTYCLGPALISLGRAAASNVRIQDAALPILKNLSYVTREDSYLVIQVGDKGLVLDKVDGPNHLKVVEEFGYELDLHCGAIRKVILAYQSPEYLDYYTRQVLDRPEAFPQTSRSGLLAELREIRETGLSVSHGEYVHDAIGIGAPVFGINGSVTASVGIIAPYSRIADKVHLEHMKEQVRHSAAELSYYMGHTFKQVSYLPELPNTKSNEKAPPVGVKTSAGGELFLFFYSVLLFQLFQRKDSAASSVSLPQNRPERNLVRLPLAVFAVFYFLISSTSAKA